MLFAVVVVDELASGVVPASTSEVATDLSLPAALAAGGLITAFHVLAIFTEAPLLAWSERVRVRWFSSGALAVLSLATLAAALAASPAFLVCCLAVYGPASGCALAAAEGALVEAEPEKRERTLARLDLAGALGDLAVPLLLGTLALAGLGWRTALAVAAIAAGTLSLLHARARTLDHRPVPTSSDPAEEQPSVLGALKFAFSVRPLLIWSAAIALTGLLDEVLIAFAVVHLADAPASLRALAVGAWTAGSLLALVWLEGVVDRLEPKRVLLSAAGVVSAALITLAATRSILLASLALFSLGAGTSCLHPLAAARAYASLPGRPALVNAVVSAFMPFDALAPLALGALALWASPRAAVLALLSAPAGFAIAAWVTRTREPAADAE